MKKVYKIISVVGARPNFMKVAPLHREFKKYRNVKHFIIHTGQHYDKNMSKIFFEDLEMPEPSEYLNVGSGTHAVQTANVMIEFEKVVNKIKPDLVIVVGDVNSTVACSLVAKKYLIPVAHVEAGLRSFDRTMPEEINRILTDSISDLLFVTEKSGLENLFNEGINKSKIIFTGNVMIDSIKNFINKADKSTILTHLNLKAKKYFLVTLHRPSNVDNKIILEKLAKLFSELPSEYKIVFPVHPRTRKMISNYNLMEKFNNEKIILTEPIGYLDFINLIKNSKIVITDSGGIQEETTFLKIPCLTLRKNTERPITVELGTNILCGDNYSFVKKEINKILNGKSKIGKIPKLWDGNSAGRIVKECINYLETKTDII